jgi:hypothetical protein
MASSIVTEHFKKEQFTAVVYPATERIILERVSMRKASGKFCTNSRCAITLGLISYVRFKWCIFIHQRVIIIGMIIVADVSAEISCDIGGYIGGYRIFEDSLARC